MAGNWESDAEIRRRVEKQLKRRGEFYVHLATYTIVNLLLWIVWLLLTPDIFPWAMVMSLPWGAGLAAHGLDVFLDSSARTMQREQAAHDAMRKIYGDDWGLTASQEDYHRVRKGIEQDFTKRKEFLIHLSVYLPINLLFWLSWLFTRDFFGFPWPVLLTLGWGIGMVAHAVDTYFQTGGRVTAREAAIQREIERERLSVEKPKRSRLVIADDGELMEMVEDDEETEEKPKRPRKI